MKDKSLFFTIWLVNDSLNNYALKHLRLNKGNIMHFSGVLVGENIAMELFCWQNGCLCMFVSTNNQHNLVIFPYVWKWA